MNKARDYITLAIESFRSGEYDAAAKFFTSALGSEDLDSFVTDIAKPAPKAAVQGPVPSSDNTLSPSLASDIDLSELSSIVDQIEARFRSESSFLDDDEQETEVRASYNEDEDYLVDEDDEDELEDDVDDDETYEVEASGSQRKKAASVGPVRLK